MCNCKKEIITDVMNAQKVRLLDILIIGPVLIICGIVPKIPFIARAALIIIGIATIAYNGFFYMKYRTTLNKNNNQLNSP